MPQTVVNLLPIVVLLVFAYLLFIRPARRRAQQVNELQAALSPGDEIMLTSGIFGRVQAVDGEKVLVEVAPDVVVTIHRGAVGKIVHDVPAEPGGSSQTDEPGESSAADDSTDDTDWPDTSSRGAG